LRRGRAQRRECAVDVLLGVLRSRAERADERFVRHPAARRVLPALRLDDCLRLVKHESGH
jgi:hypothetical protein